MVWAGMLSAFAYIKCKEVAAHRTTVVQHGSKRLDGFIGAVAGLVFLVRATSSE